MLRQMSLLSFGFWQVFPCRDFVQVVLEITIPDASHAHYKRKMEMESTELELPHTGHTSLQH